MELAKIQVNGVSAQTVYRSVIPMGVTGATVAVEYTDPMWDGLSKTVVFWGCTTKDVLNAGEVVTIPAEVVASPGFRLRMGIYGVDAENNVAIPTVWADLGFVTGAANPSGDASIDPTLPVWAQIQSAMGSLQDLQTETQKSLVAAVNEVLTKIGSGGGGASGVDGEDGATFTPHVSENGILSWTNDKGLENPEPVSIMGPAGSGGITSVNGVMPDAEGNVALDITPDGIGALPAVVDGTYPNCYYRTVDGEKEWINPPMVLGLEYRTAERWNGKAVYTRLMDCGISTSGNKTIEWDIGAKHIVRNSVVMVNGTGYGEPLPVIHENNFTSGNYTAYVAGCAHDKIQIYSNLGMANRQLYAHVWYVKE